MTEPSPDPAPRDDAADETRRSFLFRLGLGLQAVAGALLALPLVGYAISAFFLSDSRAWVSLGKAGRFAPGSTRLATYTNPRRVSWDGKTATDIPCWVRRSQDSSFKVFAINCAHLGCPVRYFEESELFMCPCHGGVYYADGSRASGPPPRGLFEYQAKVENGELLIFAGRLPTLHESA